MNVYPPVRTHLYNCHGRLLALLKALESRRRVTSKQSSGTSRTLGFGLGASGKREFRRVRRARDGPTATSSASYPCNTCGCLCLAAGQGARPRSSVRRSRRSTALYLVRTLTSGTSERSSVHRITERVQYFHVSVVNRGDAIRVLSRNFSLSRRRRW